MVSEVTYGSRDTAAAAAGELARRDAASRGLRGEPVIRSEIYRNSTYQAVYEFQGPGGSSPAPWSPDPVHASVAPPSWILVIPLGANGVWGHQTDWANAWIVPPRSGSMRFVATTGDADDRTRFPATSLSDPDNPEAAGAAASLGRKYGAPAVALVRDEENTVSVWLWRPGQQPKSLAQDVGGAVASRRAAAMSVLTDLATGRDGDGDTQDGNTMPGLGASAEAETPPSDSTVQTVPAARAEGYAGCPAHRGSAPVLITAKGVGGNLQVTFSMSSGDAGSQTAARRVLRNLDGLFLDPFSESAGGFTVTGEWQSNTLTALENALCQRGIMPLAEDTAG